MLKVNDEYYIKVIPFTNNDGCPDYKYIALHKQDQVFETLVEESSLPYVLMIIDENIYGRSLAEEPDGTDLIEATKRAKGKAKYLAEYKRNVDPNA